MKVANALGGGEGGEDGFLPARDDRDGQGVGVNVTRRAPTRDAPTGEGTKLSVIF